MGQKVGLIGCGVMGSALMSGIIHNNKVLPEDVIVWDISAKKLEETRDRLKVKAAANNAEVLNFARTIFLAVKPQDLYAVLEDIEDRHLLVSAAAGIGISEISRIVGSEKKVIRLMPNTPCLIGSGMIAISPGPGIEVKELDYIEELLKPLGKSVVLDEKFMDAVTGLSGSGPAYVFMFIEALADGGVKAGLPRDTALLLACQTVLGAAGMVLKTGEHPSVLKDRVTSPGGTTIAGIYALEKKSFKGTVIKAVEAAVKRSKELGREREDKGWKRKPEDI